MSDPYQQVTQYGAGTQRESDGIVVNPMLLIAIGLFAVIGMIAAVNFFFVREESYSYEDVLIAEDRGREIGMKENILISPPPKSSRPYVTNVCRNKSEGGTVQNDRPVLVDSGKCYVGSQIQAHLAEVKVRDAKDAAARKATTVALAAAAKKQNVVANDSWRKLAVTFAKTSELPFADEVAEQAYVDHGGTRGGFMVQVEDLTKPPLPPELTQPTD